MNNIDETIKWFGDLSIPLPEFFAYVVTGFESLGIILMILGLFTRYISVVLACIMIGAIYFVHLPNGFSVANNGVEIPLYYFLFLLFLATHGAGKYSLDRLIFERGGKV
jgi:putative oxidoreductase